MTGQMAFEMCLCVAHAPMPYKPTSPPASSVSERAQSARARRQRNRKRNAKREQITVIWLTDHFKPIYQFTKNEICCTPIDATPSHISTALSFRRHANGPDRLLKCDPLHIAAAATTALSSRKICTKLALM